MAGELKFGAPRLGLQNVPFICAQSWSFTEGNIVFEILETPSYLPLFAKVHFIIWRPSFKIQYTYSLPNSLVRSSTRRARMP